jgi:hypothetical protein
MALRDATVAERTPSIARRTSEDVCQVQLLRQGPGQVTAMREGLERWMEWRKLSRLDEAPGRSSLEHTADPAAFERPNYLRALQSWGS